MGLAEASAQALIQATSEVQPHLQVRVRSITYLAEDIRSFELVAPDGSALPPFSAGSHVDVKLPGGLIRQYSLCNDPAETHRYVVAALRDGKGRGGSIAMHDQLRAGSEISISRPRNHFPLAEAADHHVLVAGGIGITPMMSMIAVLRARRQNFHLYYSTRSPQRTAFLAELQPLVASGQASLHHDGGDPSRGLDFQKLFERQRPGAHIYYCGPAGFMDAMEAATAQWPQEAVHFERFSAPATAPSGDAAEAQHSFDIKLARSGGTFTVAPGETIVQVLGRNGIEVDVSCQEGYCGTCMTRYLDGQPMHRDSVLDQSDRESFVMICCARAKSGCLVLDL
jgi:ferredoxin-NADP reductase